MWFHDAMMSGSGQTRKWRRLPTMSVLPPTTDICALSEHFRFVPEPEVVGLFDHLVGDRKHTWRDGNAKRLSGFEIDH